MVMLLRTFRASTSTSASSSGHGGFGLLWEARGGSADMMSVLERQHSILDTGVESIRPDSRRVFPPSPRAHGVLGGGWWSRTRDPAVERGALIAAVTDRLGMVGRAGLFSTCAPVTTRSVPPPVGRLRRAKRKQVSRGETDGGRVRELT